MIRSKVIRGKVKVTCVSQKVQEARLRWFGHVARREEEDIERWIMDMEVKGYRKRGRPKTRWKDCVKIIIIIIYFFKVGVANSTRLINANHV